MNLTLFDLDNTLLCGDSDFEWSQFLMEKGVIERRQFETRTLEFYEQYRAGTLDIHAFLDFQLKPLSRHKRQYLDQWHKDFMRIKVRPMMIDAGKKLLSTHQNAGDICVIITATNSFVTAPIADEYGVKFLIATEPEHVNGEFTGRVTGVPCFREGKIVRLKSWMADQDWTWENFEHTTFYSDSLNDLPLLTLVKNPVAVNPDDTLRSHAEQHGWSILTLSE